MALFSDRDQLTQPGLRSTSQPGPGPKEFSLLTPNKQVSRYFASANEKLFKSPNQKKIQRTVLPQGGKCPKLIE